MVDAPVAPPVTPARDRPGLGYAMVAAGAVLFAVNGTVMKVTLESGLPSLRLNEIRLAGAALGLLLVVALTRPAQLRLTRRELPLLVVFGIAGVALVQWFYLLAIGRLAVGIALLIQFTAPLMVALFHRLVLRRPVRRRIWAAIVLSLLGLSLIVQVWTGVELSGAGVAAAAAAAIALAAYVLLAERGIESGRDPVSLSCWGFLFAAVAWSLIQPWWTFPFGELMESASLRGNLAELALPTWTLVAWTVALGTMAPFLLFVGALRYVPAPRASIVATLEPVVAIAVAWAWLGESFGAEQLAGAGIVLGGVLLAQTAR
jgi:drug/metabolite transporter (DMT)-like permease